jgi:hypothetical protein
MRIAGVACTIMRNRFVPFYYLYYFLGILKVAGSQSFSQINYKNVRQLILTMPLTSTIQKQQFTVHYRPGTADENVLKESLEDDLFLTGVPEYRIKPIMKELNRKFRRAGRIIFKSN